MMKRNNEKLPFQRHMRYWREFIMHKRILLFLLLFCSFSVVAQNKFIVKGKVFDSKNEPLIGASIALKGNASVGTIADLDGAFTLEVPGGNVVLTVSYIGMVSQEVKVNNRKMIVINVSSG